MARARATIKATAKRDGTGVVVSQSGKVVIMSWQEWRQLRDDIDVLHNGQPPEPRKRYRTA